MNLYTPLVSAIIPAFNDTQIVLRLIRSLKKTKYPNLEIVVVDNSPGDGVIPYLKFHKDIKKIDKRGPKNIGLTGSTNVGIKNADQRSEYILFLNSDVVMDKKMIHKLVEKAEADDEIGIVTPMILYLSYPDYVHQAGAWLDLFSGKVHINWGKKEQFLQEREVQNSGTVLLIKRRVINKIGSWDDDIFMCFEDVDYCLRAKKAGFKTWYYPKAIAYHDQEIDPNVWRLRVVKRAYLIGRNRVLVLRKHARSIISYLLFFPAFLAFYAWDAFRFKQPILVWDFLRGTIEGLKKPVRRTIFLKSKYN